MREFNSQFPDYGDGDLVVQLHSKSGSIHEIVRIAKLFQQATEFDSGIVRWQNAEPSLLELAPTSTLSRSEVLTYSAQTFDPMYNTPCT